MIVIKLIGGLGNQMFQYALGRKLTILNDAELKFDLEHLQLNNKLKLKKQVLSFFKFEIIEPRKYGLGTFNVKENFASKQEIRKLGSTLVFESEPFFSFHPEILLTRDDCCLSGFWQSEKYFQDIQDVLRKEFMLRDEFSIDDLDIAKEIKACNGVSLHIRRGDYVTRAAVNKFHGTCSLEYYAKAVDCLNQKITKPVFFVFSDDIKWAQENLKIKNPIIFVSNGKLKDYEELILMSFCKHHIIANSSFSWWGAWLNPSQEKIVVAPKKWLTDDSINTADLIPKNWIRL